MLDRARREALLDAAVAEGKFDPERRNFWREQYDANPARTEAALAVLTPVFAPESPYPRELFPELGARRRPESPLHTAVAASSPAATVTDEVVAEWTLDLVPETLFARKH
jgi:hypothetical protein